MTTYITEYYNNTELPYCYEDKELIKFKGFKNNGKLEGSCIIGYINDYNDYYYEEVNFIDNKKNGPYKIYYFNGNLKEEGIYKNDLKNGPYKEYFFNQIYEEGIYINDLKNGPYKRYNWNGNICEKGIYENNEKK